MIDSHTHINLHPLSEMVGQVVADALAGGVTAMINIGIDLETSRQSIELAERFTTVWAACGIHPNTQIKPEQIGETVAAVSHLAKHPKVLAIGEIGLDFYRDRVLPEQQEMLFRKQLDLARELSLPVIIHLRDSYERFRELWPEYNDIKGVCHAYSGDAVFTEWLLNETKLYVGLGGPITYKNYRNQDVIAMLPRKRVLLETDCPYLTPHPHRGEVNEPKYVPLILEKLAEMMSCTKAELELSTSYNAKNLFGLGLPMRGESRVFIHNMKTMDTIADQPTLSDTCLEIGAGPGTLTRRLKDKYRNMYAVEPDISEYPDIPGVTLVQKSILDVNLSWVSEYHGGKIDVWGNIPYHITGPILELLDEHITGVSQAFLLVQFEVAQRLCAKPGSSDYGIPTVLLGNRWHIRKVMNVPRELFKPVPEVDSALVHLQPRAESLVPHTEQFQRFVRHSFKQRRKMLRKSLKEYLPKNLNCVYLTKRPQELSIEDFGDFCRMAAPFKD